MLKKHKKCKGQIELVCPVMLLLFLLVIIGYEMQKSRLEATADYADNALVLSNLASALIDVGEYGRSHSLIITDADAAFEIYQRALKANMELDDAWCSHTQAASGAVQIVDYIIYNVKGSDVEVIRMGRSPAVYTVSGGLGTVAAPNGQTIASTSVYSRITFPVEGIWGLRTDAVREKLVDVVGGL